MIVDIIEEKTGKVVKTYCGPDAQERAWQFYGRSHLCPDLPESAPRREFDEYRPEVREIK